MRNRRPFLGQGGVWDYPGEEPLWAFGLPEGEERRGRPPERGEARRPEPAREGHWTEERRGIWDYTTPEEEVDPRIDRLVWSWVKKNPHNIVDILTGMYGLAGRDEARQAAVRDALEAARGLDSFFPERKQAEEIGRRIEDFPHNEENYRSFRQALLNALPDLIQGARKKKEHEKADSLIYLADQIFAL